MEMLSYALNYIVIIYLWCYLPACDAIPGGDQAPEQKTAVTTTHLGGEIYVSSLTVSSGSARNYTFGERYDGSREDMVTSPGSQSDKTVNAPTLDNGCRDGNVTYPCLNTSVGPDLPQEDPFVITVINRVQLTITCAGFLANGVTYLTLSCNGGRFSVLILLVLKHQSLVDMGICGMCAMYLLLPAGNWLTGNHIADAIVCYTWHSQGLYWAAMFVSSWNLVLMGIERYIKICKPLLYNTVTKRQFLYTFAGIYVGSFVFIILGYIQVDFINGECLRRNIGDFGYPFYYGYSIVIPFLFYLFPVGAFVFIYG